MAYSATISGALNALSLYMGHFYNETPLYQVALLMKCNRRNELPSANNIIPIRGNWDTNDKINQTSKLRLNTHGITIDSMRWFFQLAA